MSTWNIAIPSVNKIIDLDENGIPNESDVNNLKSLLEGLKSYIENESDVPKQNKAMRNTRFHDDDNGKFNRLFIDLIENINVIEDLSAVADNIFAIIKCLSSKNMETKSGMNMLSSLWGSFVGGHNPVAEVESRTASKTDYGSMPTEKIHGMIKGMVNSYAASGHEGPVPGDFSKDLAAIVSSAIDKFSAISASEGGNWGSLEGSHLKVWPGKELDHNYRDPIDVINSSLNKANVELNKDPVNFHNIYEILNDLPILDTTGVRDYSGDIMPVGEKVRDFIISLKRGVLTIGLFYNSPKSVRDFTNLIRHLDKNVFSKTDLEELRRRVKENMGIDG